MRRIGRSYRVSASPTAIGSQRPTAGKGRSHRAWGLSAVLLSAWAVVALAESSAGESATRPADSDRPAARRGEDARPDGTAKKDTRQRREAWRDRGDRSDQAGPLAGDDRPRGPRYMGGGGDTGDDRDILTAEERERLREFVKENFPELADRLKVGRIPRGVAWPLLRLMRIQKSDPELAAKLIDEHRIEMDLMEARREYRDAPSETARETIRKNIHQLLEKRFDVRQARLELEIRDLQKRIEKAKERLAKQQANKDQLVDAELEHLTDAIEEASSWGDERATLPETPGGPLGPGPRSERAQPRER